ncbi:MAG: type II toxin-antitoxin system VapB family antitoxin [Alphaproteobacteria bacterium]|nr:type II toxin-antitoxin system VapB family antitoxin [Alphaproteobacteria bacterium]
MEFSTRTTVNLDDELVAEAVRLTRIEERPALLREALKALIERESARRLARLGSRDPKAGTAPRRRSGA